MSVTVFLSSVSDEFGADRKQLRGDFTRHDIHVKEQDEFKDLGRGTLAKLDEYVVHSDAVVHLVGKLAGASPGAADETALLEKYPRLTTKLPPLDEALKDGGLSYTQWEAWLALYHDKVLLIAKAPGDLGAGQAKHLARLKAAERFPCCEFTSADNLAKQLYAHGILDLLVKDYAEAAARERDVALGFIHEMASKVAGDRNLDLDGKKQAVRNAIEIYEKEIAGGLTQTNFGDIVDTALAKAKRQVDKGQSGLARATLRKAAEDMRRDEEERRASYVAGVTELCNRARDIALASYDGEAAAEAVVALADAVHGVDRAGVFEALWTETNALLDHGSDKGSNVHLVAAIALSRKLRDAASTPGERGTAHLWLGHALMRLGERERERARLTEAVAAYREALEEWTPEVSPYWHDKAHGNLAKCLALLEQRRKS
jgi:tetratricopeptide (TPR) repeat protein